MILKLDEKFQEKITNLTMYSYFSILFYIYCHLLHLSVCLGN